MKGIINKNGLRRAMIRMLCMCAAALITCMGASAQEMDVPQLLEPVGVKMDTVEAYISDIYELDIYEGSVAPNVEGLSFSVAGVVKEIHVIAGQEVKAGDVLITLDQDNQRDKIERIEREIEYARTNSDYEDQLARIDRSILELELEMLMVQDPENADAIALKRLDIEQFDLNAELARELRQLELSRLQEELDALNIQVVQNVLVAPSDGTVLHLADMERGSYVNAFTQILFLAIDSQMHIETEYIAENELNRANRIYAHVGSGIYELEPIPQDQKDFYSKMLAGEKITSQFEVLEKDGQVTMGAYAMVCVQKSYVEDALVIPRNALYTDSGSRYIYVVEDNVRIRREITAGLITDTLVEITGGLEEGEVVYVQE